MYRITDIIDENIERNRRYEGEPSHLALTQTVRNILAGQLYPQILEFRNGEERFARMEQDTIASYVANGWITVEEVQDILNRSSNKRIFDYFNRRPALPQWLEYVQSTLELPVTQVTISTEEFNGHGLETMHADEQSERIIEIYFPHLLEDFVKDRDRFKFRYLNVGKHREEQFGNIQDNIQKYGIDFDLSRGWEGIWTRTGTIYGAGFHPEQDSSYLIIYNDPDNLLEGPGFYTENALSFIRLVIAGKTLKDLLHTGGVLKVENTQEM